MDKSLINFWMNFPAINQTSVMAKPRHRAFDLPSMTIASKAASILNFFDSKVSSWSNELNSASTKISSQTIRIISLVTDQTLWFSLKTFKRCFNQRLLVWSGRVKGHCQRNALAVCHHHKLRTLTPSGDFDFRAPFLATIKWPSIKHWAHWIFLCLSNSLIKLCQIFSQTPWSSQSLKRLQQVLGLGYSLGKSFHRAPLRKTQRMPSSTNRLCFQGRPLLFNFGSNGSIFCHCFSLKYFARLIDFSPMSLFIDNHLQ